VLSEYLKVLPKNNSLPTPVKAIIKKLACGQDVTAEEFIKEAKEYID